LIARWASAQVRFEPLSLVQTGGRIRLSVKRRSIDLLVDDKELKRRAAIGKLEAETPARGYARLYAQEILGADQGCDFAFLKPRRPLGVGNRYVNLRRADSFAR
jgi:Dehydratase family